MKTYIYKYKWHIGFVFLLLFAMLFYVLSIRHATNITKASVYDFYLAKEDVFLEAIEIEEEKDRIVITANGGSDRFVKKYHNWTMGVGTGSHFISELALVKDDVVYCLTTIPDGEFIGVEEDTLIRYTAIIQSVFKISDLAEGSYKVALIVHINDIQELLVSDKGIEVGGA